MSESADAAVWLQYAQDDLVLARRALSEPPVTSGVFFHAQQAAEKALKGYLIARGDTEVPRTHLLRQLAARLADHRAELPPVEIIRFLDTYGVGVRYPDNEAPPAEASDLALRHAEELVAFVTRQLAALDGDTDGD
jgi:HEPN domain-containing protein